MPARRVRLDAEWRWQIALLSAASRGAWWNHAGCVAVAGVDSRSSDATGSLFAVVFVARVRAQFRVAVLSPSACRTPLELQP